MFTFNHSSSRHGMGGNPNHHHHQPRERTRTRATGWHARNNAAENCSHTFSLTEHQPCRCSLLHIPSRVRNKLSVWHKKLSCNCASVTTLNHPLEITPSKQLEETCSLFGRETEATKKIKNKKKNTKTYLHSSSSLIAKPTSRWGCCCWFVCSTHLNFHTLFVLPREMICDGNWFVDVGWNGGGWKFEDSLSAGGVSTSWKILQLLEWNFHNCFVVSKIKSFY